MRRVADFLVSLVASMVSYYVCKWLGGKFHEIRGSFHQIEKSRFGKASHDTYQRFALQIGLGVQNFGNSRMRPTSDSLRKSG